jgi:hypothetical protein
MAKTLSNGAHYGKLRRAMLLSGSVLLENAGYMGMDAMEYVFKRHDPKKLPWAFRIILAFGYWLLRGVATGAWRWPKYPIDPKLERESVAKAG